MVWSWMGLDFDLREQPADSLHDHWRSLGWRLLASDLGIQQRGSVARVTTGGVVLEPGGVSVAGPMTGPTAGLPGGGVELVWSVASNSQYDVSRPRFRRTTRRARPKRFRRARRCRSSRTLRSAGKAR